MLLHRTLCCVVFLYEIGNSDLRNSADRYVCERHMEQLDLCCVYTYYVRQHRVIARQYLSN